jgi:hypothetical protein
MSTTLQQLTAAQTNKEVAINRNFETTSWSGVYGKKQSTSSGLTWGYYGGRWGGFTVADGTHSLTNAADNYIVVLKSNGVASVSTSTTNWNNTTDYARAYKVTTAGSVVTATEDHRAGPSGVHGGGGVGSVDASAVTYTPATLSNWDSSSDPGNADDALDELATRVVALESGGAGDASAVTYTPAVLGDWSSSSDPGNADDAFDELAARLTAVEGGSSGWFDVTAYGAVGDGATDNSTTIGNAVTALNAAGQGVLYFPAAAGSYKTAGGHVITAKCLLLGDGAYGASDIGQSTVQCTSTTAVLFELQAKGSAADNIGLLNTGTATAGAGLYFSECDGVRITRTQVKGFWINVDTEDSVAWFMHASNLHSPRKYALRIRNTASPDAGDWSISDCIFASVNAADAGIYIQSSGGGKIVNCKFNGAGSLFVNSIYLNVDASAQTAILLIANNSFENSSGAHFKARNGAGASWPGLQFCNNEFGHYASVDDYAIDISATSTGIFDRITIVGNHFLGWSSSTTQAVTLTNIDNVAFGLNVNKNFTAALVTSGCTNVLELASQVTASANLTNDTIVRGDGGAKGAQTSGITVSDSDEIHGYLAKLNLQTGTTYTIDVAGIDTDSGKIVDLNNGSAIAVTLPATAPVGFACTCVQTGAGQVTFASTGSGTLANRQSHTKTAGNKAMVTLYVRANAGGSAAAWILGGDTAA